MTAAPAAGRRRRWMSVAALLAGALIVAGLLAIRTIAGGGHREGDGMTKENVADDGAPLLTYELLTRHPTKRGNLRLVIGTDGGVRAQRNDVEPPAGQDWAADLPAEPSVTVRNARARLGSILDGGRFFEMDEHQVNEAGTDGTIRVLTWNGDGGPRTVTVDRARSADFDRIVGEISRLVSVPGM